MRICIDTPRLKIRPLTMAMAADVHILSLDEDNRRFNPDEVFETQQDAADALEYLIGCYNCADAPLVYAVLLGDANIGHVELVPLDDGAWEIGYHIGMAYTGKGYATEAVRAFLSVAMRMLGLPAVQGVCIADNAASRKVLERCGFALTYEGDGVYQDVRRHICRYIYQN